VTGVAEVDSVDVVDVVAAGSVEEVLSVVVEDDC